MLNTYFNWNKSRMHCFMILFSRNLRARSRAHRFREKSNIAIGYFQYGLDVLRDLVLNGGTSMTRIGRTVKYIFIFQQLKVVME